MSAEILRRAASLMRERAEKAAPGPWRVCAEGSEGSRFAPDCDDKRERSRFIGIANGRVQPEDGFNATHIASWPPAVALAVADWLDESADHLEDMSGFPHEAVCPTAREGLECSVLGQALTVARAYLGTEVAR